MPLVTMPRMLSFDFGGMQYWTQRIQSNCGYSENRRPCQPTQCFPLGQLLVKRLPLRLNYAGFLRINVHGQGFPAHPQPHGFSWFFYHGWCLCAGYIRRLPPLFCTCAILMGFYTGAIQTHILQIGFQSQIGKDSLEQTLSLPLHKTTVYRVPRSVSFR